MKKLSLLVFLLFAFVAISIGQRTITGVVADVDGIPLIGASVLAQGTSIGTITDIDGSFSLSVPDGTTALEISYTGYSNQVIDVTNSSNVTVSLAEGTLLEELVIVGLGSNRNSRSVTYANQKVSSEDLNSSPSKNALEALRGKTAGVRITTGSGSVGASNRIVLRGESSLTGDNNALIVVDGIPIDNGDTRGGATTGLFSAQDGYADYGNRFNDINPEDIESITVLKGASATALYGSRGASGVVLVTTKKGAGKDGSTKVRFNTNSSIQKAYVLLQRQDQYGQGFGIPFAAIPSFDSGENWSWGPAFDGVVRPWTSPVDADGDGDVEFLSRPYSAVPNQLENFFRTGRTFTNNFSIEGSNGGMNFYGSYGNMTQYGILDNTDYKRHSLKFGMGAQMSDNFKIETSISYANIDQNTALEGYRPFEGQNAYANAIQSPVNIPFTELRDYNSPFHDFNGYYGSYTSNPYFILNEFGNNGKIDNVLGSVALTYTPIEKLILTTRAGVNIVSTNIEEHIPIYQYNPHQVWSNNLQFGLRGGRSNNAGEYFELSSRNINTDFMAQASYSMDLTDRIAFTPTVGWNLFKRGTNTIRSRTVGGLVQPEWYHLDNSAGTIASTVRSSNYWLYGLYGNLQFGLDDKLFIDYSARSDFSSTLPPGENAFFYQSIGVSAIVSDYLNLSGSTVEFLKLRGSYGTVGKDAPLYALYSSTIGSPTIQSLANGHDLSFPHNGRPGFTVSNFIGNPGLKPELTTTAEFGIDGGFFGDRVNIEYTYYNSVHTNQIVQVDLAPSTGYGFTFLNIGKMTNTGHELGLTVRPLGTSISGFSWDLNFLFATNENLVVDVLDPENEGDQLVVGNLPGTVNIVAKEGFPFGTFQGTVIKTTEDGRTVVDATGLPVLANGTEELGSYQPDYTLSLGTAVGYKGLRFNILFDQKSGGQFLSFTKDFTEFNGTSLTSLIGDRQAFVVENSVQEQSDGTFVENTTETTPYDYLRTLPNSAHLIDASYIKLREIGLTYDFSKSFVKNLPFTNLSLGIYGQNLKFWLPEENTFSDPEVNGPGLTGNATGVETSQTPPSKSFGVKLNVTF